MQTRGTVVSPRPLGMGEGNTHGAGAGVVQPLAPSLDIEDSLDCIPLGHRRGLSLVQGANIDEAPVTGQDGGGHRE